MKSILLWLLIDERFTLYFLLNFSTSIIEWCCTATLLTTWTMYEYLLLQSSNICIYEGWGHAARTSLDPLQLATKNNCCPHHWLLNMRKPIFIYFCPPRISPRKARRSQTPHSAHLKDMKAILFHIFCYYLSKIRTVSRIKKNIEQSSTWKTEGVKVMGDLASEIVFAGQQREKLMKPLAGLHFWTAKHLVSSSPLLSNAAGIW
jgi:hypothetical protein